MKRTLYAMLLLAACLSLASVSEHYCGDLTVGDVLGIEPPSIAASIAAETVPSGALSITGPDGAVKPNEDAWLKIGGLTLDEIKTAKAAGNFDLTVFPLNGVRVHAAYDWLNDRLELMFRASDTGEHLVKLHLVRDGKLEIAAVAVTVTGKEPSPNPPVPPTPPPTPGDRFVLIVSETKDRTPQEAATLATLRRWLTDQKIQWRIIDPTTEAEWMRPHAAKLKEAGVKGTALMVFVPASDSHPGAYLAVEPLPGRSQEAIARIEEALK